MPRRQRDAVSVADQSSVSDEVDAVPPELAYYFPDPYWLAHEAGWIKSLLLFFDGVATLLPDYMRGRQFVADPELAEPLENLGLLHVLEPEVFVDAALSQKLAEYMIELIDSGAFLLTPTDGCRTARSP